MRSSSPDGGRASPGCSSSPESYGDDVLAGVVPACKWVRLAVERHRRDLVDGHGRGLRFEPALGLEAVEYFAFLRHSKGEWAGQPLVLEPWQRWHTYVLFGWVRSNGLRRFRHAYIEVPRKNGKSTEAAGIGLLLFDGDGEPGAEVYTAATKLEQARIVHQEAVRMVRKSPDLSARIRVPTGTYANNLSNPFTDSKFEPLGRDSKTLDGLNVHGAIADELHAWPDRDLLDVIETATGSRRQPMIFRITTAGTDLESVCGYDHVYTQQVLEGTLQDDAWWGIIYTIDEGDDPWSPTAWRKANPNYGVSVKMDDLEDQARKAQGMPSAMGAFLRLRLNVWTQTGTRWMPPEKWDACAGPVVEAELAGRLCYGGLDLASTSDITAFSLVFPPLADGEPWKVLPRLWIPKESMLARAKTARVPYEAWVRDGFLQTTPGDVTDHAFILEQIRKDATTFDLREIAFDRWGAAQVVTKLQEIAAETGHSDEWVIQFGQGFQSMSAPMKELERLVLGRQLAHGGHPALAWMASNVVADEDAAGNVKPNKRLSRQKIDGIVATIMALGRAMTHQADASVYESRGVVSL